MLHQNQTLLISSSGYLKSQSSVVYHMGGCCNLQVFEDMFKKMAFRNRLLFSSHSIVVQWPFYHILNRIAHSLVHFLDRGNGKINYVACRLSFVCGACVQIKCFLFLYRVEDKIIPKSFSQMTNARCVVSGFFFCNYVFRQIL